MATAGRWRLVNASNPKVPLSDEMIQALESLGFQEMTPVQAATIPRLLDMKDVAVEAETGSGKTLAFLVPIIQFMINHANRSKKKPNDLRVLILEPTRELARQVYGVATQLLEQISSDMRPVLFTGGAITKEAEPNNTASWSHEFVVATPGRLEAALVAGQFSLKQFEFLVLDEADRLLDMGFQITLSSILSYLPKQRRTSLFSATLEGRISELSRAGMRDPVKISIRIKQEAQFASAVEDKVAAPTNHHRSSLAAGAVLPRSLVNMYHITTPEQKLPHALQVISSQSGKFIVYVLTCSIVEFYSRLPWESLMNICNMFRKPSDSIIKSRPVYFLHGKMLQPRRVATLQNFAHDPNAILFCTDVASRGLDIPGVDWIIQLDAPQLPEAYVHRVGRTARMGRAGHALLYLAPSEDTLVQYFQVQHCDAHELQESRFVRTSFVDEESRAKFQQQLIGKIKKAVLSDRAILELSEKAFLSYLRGYKQHRLSQILKLNDLDIGSVARSMFLFRMPRIAEFKILKNKINFERDPNVDLKQVQFKDKLQEQKRQQLIARAMENPVKYENTAKRKENKRKRRDKKEELKQTKKQALFESVRQKYHGHEATASDDDLEGLFEDARELRKERRGKGKKAAAESDDSVCEARSVSDSDSDCKVEIDNSSDSDSNDRFSEQT